VALLRQQRKDRARKSSNELGGYRMDNQEYERQTVLQRHPYIVSSSVPASSTAIISKFNLSKLSKFVLHRKSELFTHIQSTITKETGAGQV
jgi:hypothetical protein